MRRQIECLVCLSVFGIVALGVSPTRGAPQWQQDASGQLFVAWLGPILFCLFYFVIASIRKAAKAAAECHLSTWRRYPDMVKVLKRRQPFMSMLLRDVEVEDPP